MRQECKSFVQVPGPALDQYLQSGVHVERDVFDPGFCDQLIDEANGFPAVKRGDFRTVLQPHRVSDLFMRALCHPAVTGIVRKILAGPISGLQTQFFYCRPGTPGFQPHQDNWFVKAPRGTFASVWVALADVSRDNGCLYVYPGTHLERLLPVRECEAAETMLQDANALRWRCAVPEASVAFDLAMTKGAGAFLDGHTVHGSHPNISPHYRYAVLLTYIRRGTPYVPGRYAHREEVQVD